CERRTPDQPDPEPGRPGGLGRPRVVSGREQDPVPRQPSGGRSGPDRTCDHRPERLGTQIHLERQRRAPPARLGVGPLGDDFRRLEWSYGYRLKRRDEMPEYRIGTREEWQTARNEFARLEAGHAERNEEIKRKRRELPWVAVEKEYVFETEEGRNTLAELFDGRSQLLAYNIMYGPDYSTGACPGCTSLADGFDGGLIHLNKRDVTFICLSRAPIDELVAYKQRMGWQFPYVSTSRTDFPFDLQLALTKEQAREIPEVREMIDDPPDWLQFWSTQIG